MNLLPLRPITVLCLGLSLHAATPAVASQDHILPMAEMDQHIAKETKVRRDNVAKATAFFALPQVSQTLHAAKLDPKQMQQAVSLLNDSDLSRFVQRSEQARMDIEGGALNNTQLTYIVIALVTALVVTIIFVA